MVIDRMGRPLVAPKATWDLLEEYFPGTGPLNWTLPETLITWLLAQLAYVGRELELPTNFQPLVVQRRDGKTLTLRILVGRLTGDQAVLLLQERAPDAFETLAAELGLTQREKEVLRQIQSGRTAAEIADSLFISKRTVDKHLENVYGKLGVQSRPAAIAMTFLR
jgi:DNA-binding CsgD family transcriptional regulator